MVQHDVVGLRQQSRVTLDDKKKKSQNITLQVLNLLYEKVSGL